MMVVAVMMMPGFGRGLGDASTDQKSCGEHSDRRARLGYIPQRRLLELQHVVVPRNKYCHICGKWSPRPVLRVSPFGGLIRHKRGSRSFWSPLKYLVTEHS